jgi:hypothetical protein
LHRWFTKDVDYDIEFIGGIKNSILVEKVCSTPPFAALNCLYNRYLSADSLIELLLQHQKQVEIAGEGSILGGLGNLLDGDNRFNFIVNLQSSPELHPDEGGISSQLTKFYFL